MAKTHKPDEYTARMYCHECPKCQNQKTVRAIRGKVFGKDHPFKWSRDTPSDLKDGGYYRAWRCVCDPKRYHDTRWRPTPHGLRRRSYGCGYEGPAYEFCGRYK